MRRAPRAAGVTAVACAQARSPTAECWPQGRSWPALHEDEPIRREQVTRLTQERATDRGQHRQAAGAADRWV